MAKTIVIKRKAVQVDMQIDKGSTFRSDLIWLIGTPLTPKDLTGWTARMQLRLDIDDTEILHELTTENGGILIDGANGKISLFISDTDSTAFDWEEAVYGLELIDTQNTNDVRRLTYGVLSAFDEVTR